MPQKNTGGGEIPFPSSGRQLRLISHRPESRLRAGALPVLSGRRGHIRDDGPFFEAILPPWRESIVLDIPSGPSCIGCALTPGVIPAIRTFEDRINLHLHLHILVTEGGVDEAGVFPKIPRFDDSRLAFRYFELNLTSDHAAIYHP